ncbi:MAG: energy-coupling factor transporter transmembrane component T family protein [Sulfitobacter sp.]
MISLTSPVKTRAHGWRAGAKLGALCSATVVLFAWPDLRAQLAGFTLMLVLYALPGRQFLRSGLRMLWRLWPFVALLLIWSLWQGEIAEGILIVLRMLTAVGLANLVTMTTSLTEMMALIGWLLAPLARLGLRPRLIELAMALAIRFTPVLIGHGDQLRQAWRARSPRRAGWHLVVPMAVAALDEADHVALALRARGGV